MNAKRGLVDEPGGYAGDWITKKKKMMMAHLGLLKRKNLIYQI